MALLCGCPLLLLLQKADWAVCSRGQRSNSSCQKQIGGEPQGGVKGQWPVDCPRYDGPGGGRGRLHRAAPMNYEENQWRQEVTRGGQAISSAPGDLFWHWEEKRKKKWRKREEKCDQQGAVFLRILQFKRRVSHHWELFENTSVEVKNKSTTRYEAQAHNCYVTKDLDNFRKQHLRKCMRGCYFHSCWKIPEEQGPTSLWAQQPVSDNTFFYCTCVRANRPRHPRSTIKQTIICHFKRRAIACLVFMFLSVPWKTWTPVFHGQRDVVCEPVTAPPLSLIALCLLICLPLLIHICVLGAPFLPLDICQYGLDLGGPSRSSEARAGDSLENRPLN